MLFAVAFLCFMQAITLYRLLGARSTQVIPLPCGVTESVTVGAHTVSVSYLSEMTRYLTMLRFNYTPATIASQSERVLQYVDGQAYGQFKEKWAEETETAEADDISMSFSPLETRVNAADWTVCVDGDLIETVGKVPLGTRRVTVVVKYRYANGQLRVLSMVEAPAESGEGKEKKDEKAG